jgi:histone H2A
MGARGPTISRQAKAGVTLSVARINKLIRKSQATYVSSRAPLYVAGVMETIVDCVVKRAAENVRNGQRNRVNNADVINAVRSDPDLARLCVGFAFASNARPTKAVMHILSSEDMKRRRKQRSGAKSANDNNNTGLD